MADLLDVVHSAGREFEGLQVSRADTERFLRGDPRVMMSGADRDILTDLREAGQYILDHRDEPITAATVRAINARLSRSAALHPGRLRTRDQQIGVTTARGRHEPSPVTDKGLEQILARAAAEGDDLAVAIATFIALASAQPFEDGNKRTALLVANAYLLASGSDEVLMVPGGAEAPGMPTAFADALALAYVDGDHQPVSAMLRAARVPLGGQ
ncbi:Fic family protein [Gordonia malaquae]|uniref:Fic family protein n=1 Tax=Gordonia malaquae TaxID=410332 RepID=UPI00301984F6